MEVINNILDSLVSSFDFAYCLVVNIATYLIIKAIDAIRCYKKPKVTINEWIKRLVLVCIILLTGVLYKSSGIDTRIIINSAILAPVSWSWIFKPIFKLLNIDYKKHYKEEENGEEQ